MQQAWQPFTFTGKDPFVPFRDATSAPNEFPITIPDILSGLQRAVQNKILCFSDFDIDLHNFCEDPHHADLHVIVPGKFVALRGPVDSRRFDVESGLIDMVPEDFFEIFRRLRVEAVVRLNHKQVGTQAH